MSQIVRCPKCNSAVSVGPNQGGQRLQCPSCLQQFIAPAAVSGAASASSEDEDWLSLDDTPAAPSPIASGPAAASQPKSAPLPPLTLDDDPVDAVDEVEEVELVPEGASSSDDPFALAPTPGDAAASDDPYSLAPAPELSSARADDNLFANLPSLDMGGQPQAAPTSPASNPQQPDYVGQAASEESFRVKCHVCSSVLYAKPHQSGGTIRCSDCHSDVRVPQPPRKPTKPKNQPEAATFQLSEAEDNRRPDPFVKSADELLKKAAEEPDEKPPKPAYDVPDVKGWLASVFGIFLDLGVIFHFGVLCAILAIPAAVIAWQPIFVIAAIPLGMIGTAVTVSCGFAILQSVANEHESVEDWPTVDPTSWFDSMGMVFVATAIAVGPPYVLAQVLGGAPALSIAFVMFGVYALFPFLLLSMMDLQSITGLFSPDVTKSVTRCQEDWGTFYFSSGMIFGLLMTYFLFVSYTPTTIAVGVGLAIAVVFLYFAMLGRLAQAIGGEAELGGLDKQETSEEPA